MKKATAPVRRAVGKAAEKTGLYKAARAARAKAAAARMFTKKLGGRMAFWRNPKPPPPPALPLAPPRAFALMDLPRLYTELYCRYIDRVPEGCPRGKAPAVPAVCLHCGALLCCQASCCRSARGEGACTRHALACSGGVGAS